MQRWWMVITLDYTTCIEIIEFHWIFKYNSGSHNGRLSLNFKDNSGLHNGISLAQILSWWPRSLTNQPVCVPCHRSARTWVCPRLLSVWCRPFRASPRPTRPPPGPNALDATRERVSPICVSLDLTWTEFYFACFGLVSLPLAKHVCSPDQLTCLNTNVRMCF